MLRRRMEYVEVRQINMQTIEKYWQNKLRQIWSNAKYWSGFKNDIQELTPRSWSLLQSRQFPMKWQSTNIRSNALQPLRSRYPRIEENVCMSAGRKLTSWVRLHLAHRIELRRSAGVLISASCLHRSHLTTSLMLEASSVATESFSCKSLILISVPFLTGLEASIWGQFSLLVSASLSWRSSWSTSSSWRASCMVTDVSPGLSNSAGSSSVGISRSAWLYLAFRWRAGMMSIPASFATNSLRYWNKITKTCLAYPDEDLPWSKYWHWEDCLSKSDLLLLYHKPGKHFAVYLL